MLYSLTNILSTNHPTISINLYYSQCLPPQTHTLDIHPPKKHFILSILTLIPHLNYQNMTSTTFTIKSKPWLTNITLIWKPWMTTSLLCLKNSLIQVLRQTSKNNNSHIFHPNYQPIKNASRKWTSKKHRSSPCRSISQKFRPNYQLMKTDLINWPYPTSTNLK